ncbi:hypothetical protein [Streptomyces sp. CB02400]|uniref:hypothetical protein n=1 Tax=Streptomyces sp. CB02400 TaxID=1703944 RepID=UPI001911867C|nr:hypothetical protein [Streptomyces sp. CB02400]
MTTFSSSLPSNEPVIPTEAATAPPSATTATATGTHRQDRALTRPLGFMTKAPAATADLVDPVTAGKPYGDPVGDLVRTAVSDRSLEDVAALVTALERSPEHTRAVVEALRAAGIDRSVEDVTRLVALLTRPPRDAGSADETIRAAAAHRSVEDVTLLVALLHSEPLAPHCREEALRAAATDRSVDELVELIDRLAAQRPVTPEPHPGDETGRRTPEPAARSVIWSTRLAAVALAVCAVTHFPLRHDGVPLSLHAFAVGLSVFCTALALILVVRPGAMALAGAVVVPALLATAHAYGDSLPSAALPRSVNLALAPPWLATPTAAAAALLALASLAMHMKSFLPTTRWTPKPRSTTE